MKLLLRFALITILFTLFSPQSNASHIMGGYITWDCIESGSNSGKFVFKLTLYRDCNGVALNGMETMRLVNYGPDTSFSMNIVYSSDISPICDTATGSALSCGIGPPYSSMGGTGTGAIQLNHYISDTIRLHGTPPAGGWILVWNSCCRNTAIDNFPNPGTASFTLRTVIYPYTSPGNSQADSMNHCYDDGPSFIFEETPLICSGSFEHGQFMAYDPDEDSLHYAFDVPLTAYFPSSAWTYDPAAPTATQNPEPWFSNSGYPLSNGYFPDSTLNVNNFGVSIDPNTGLISGEVHTVGSFLSCASVSSYRHGQKISMVSADLSMFIVNCDTTAVPLIAVPGASSPSLNTFVVHTFPSDTIDLDVLIWDPDTGTQHISMSWSSPLFGPGQAGFQNAPYPTLNPTYQQDGPDTLVASIHWPISWSHVDSSGGAFHQEVPIYIQAMDDQCPLPRRSNALLTIVISNIDTGLISPKTVEKCPLDSITIQANGSYDFYWSTGEIGSSIKVVDEGIYTVYYDTLGIRIRDEVEVLFKSPIFMDTFIEDSLFRVCTDSIMLNAPSGYFDPVWISPLDSTASSTFQPSISGQHVLEMSDSLGCTYFDAFNFVKVDHTDTNYNICKVTVDVDLNKCRVVFPDLDSYGIDTIYLYQQGGWGYVLVSTLPADILSWVHPNSTPDSPYGQQYLMEVQDSCGNISEMSGIRTSFRIHYNPGSPSPSIEWTPVGYAQYSHYKIYVSEDNGPFVLDQMVNFPATIVALDPATYNNPKFFIRVDNLNTSCPISPTDSIPSAIISNVLDFTNISSLDESEGAVSVYPNPSSGIFRVNSSEPWRQIEIYDMNGRLIISLKWEDDMEVDLSQFPGGLYSLVLISDNNRHVELIERH